MRPGYLNSKLNFRKVIRGRSYSKPKVEDFIKTMRERKFESRNILPENYNNVIFTPRFVKIYTEASYIVQEDKKLL
jgi:hypothetical protein